MSRPGLVIDSQRFAREGRSLHGSLASSKLPRLVGEVGQLEGPLLFSLRGSVVDGRGILELTIDGTVSFNCQRCLQAYSEKLHIEGRFRLVPDGEPWPEDDLTDDACDALPADASMDVAALVEDEVLLALPAVPRHAQCAPPGTAKVGGVESPFAVLGSLKRH